MDNLLSRTYEKYKRVVTPEKEYVVGGAVLGFFVIALLSPEQLPPYFDQAYQAIIRVSNTPVLGQKPPPLEKGLLGAVDIGTVIMVDGARRIVQERLPYGKALIWLLKENIKTKLGKK
jgi:hypothetical protein